MIHIQRKSTFLCKIRPTEKPLLVQVARHSSFPTFARFLELRLQSANQPVHTQLSAFGVCEHHNVLSHSSQCYEILNTPLSLLLQLAATKGDSVFGG